MEPQGLAFGASGLVGHLGFPILGIVLVVLGRYLTFGYLDPAGVELSGDGSGPHQDGPMRASKGRRGLLSDLNASPRTCCFRYWGSLFRFGCGATCQGLSGFQFGTTTLQCCNTVNLRFYVVANKITP